MKVVLATIACAALAIATVAAQGQAQDPTTPQQTPKPDVSMTGCLIQGSSPAVFIFDNAKKDPKDKMEKAARYVVVAVGEDLNLRSNLNHEVQLLGDPETKTLPTGKVEEKDLPRFTAKAITVVANTCTAAESK